MEVRFNKLSVTADVFTTSSRALPSLPNFFLNAAQVAFTSCLLLMIDGPCWSTRWREQASANGVVN